MKARATHAFVLVANVTIAVAIMLHWYAGRAWKYVGGHNLWKPGGED